ncbi:MAG: hypothetical protein JNM98_03815 [Rhodocyclaceae bacterium]|nr:hypothetical protein [Rhodocyclaceae bacterium]
MKFLLFLLRCIVGVEAGGNTGRRIGRFGLAALALDPIKPGRRSLYAAVFWEINSP